MAYFINIFSPSTYEAFFQSYKDIYGFRENHRVRAENINIGDKLISYITKLSRWAGVLSIESGIFIDHTPLFVDNEDPYFYRVKIKPIIILPKELSIPIFEPNIWNNLSFTKKLERSDKWAGKFRGSLAQLSSEDGEFLEEILLQQADTKKMYHIDEKEYKKYLLHKVRSENKVLTVSIPEDTEDEKKSLSQIKESIKIQAAIAEIGEKMHFKIWVTNHDRNSIIKSGKFQDGTFINELPLNYNSATINTIEQIDVIWLKNRSIVRAFEVEHTTAIYSGLLRMADLLSLQSNLAIKLHIVAPLSRREKVLSEIQRPVFSLLERGPLSNTCTFLSYESILELKNETLLQHLTDSVLEEFEEVAE